MKLIRHRLFHGPNIHRRGSVLVAVLDVEGAAPIPTNVLRERIAARMPDVIRGVAAHAVANPTAGSQDASWYDVVGALTIVLQDESNRHALGYQVQSRGSDAQPVLFIDVDDGEVAVGALALAIDLANALARTEADAPGPLAERVAAFLRARNSTRFDWITGLLADAARARDVPVMKLLPDRGFAVFGHGHRHRRMLQCFADTTSALAARITRDKHTTTALLAAAFVPVPVQRLIHTKSDLAAAVHDIGFPLVVKGRNSDHGISVTTNIRSNEELQRGIERVRQQNDEILIEKHIAGDDYRITVVDGKVAAAARRIPPQVVGDGKRTIRELVALENTRRRNAPGHLRVTRPLALDDEATAMLSRVDMNADSVPADGQVVRLRGAANISQGGLAIDVTDDVHPDIRKVVERAARVVGLDLAGIDVLTTDITRPLEETDGAVIEVNNFPGLRPHYVTPTPPRDVAGAVIDYLFPAPHRGRIPTVAVTGTNGKTTTCRMIARIFETAGMAVGTSTTAGVKIAGEVVAKGDLAGGKLAELILRDSRVEAAVLEFARGGLIKNGMRIADCDVGIVTNVAADHMGEYGINSLADMARVKRVVIDAARRAAVLNANDPYTAAMARDVAVEAWLFSSIPDSPTFLSHVASGGQGLVAAESAGREAIVHCRGTERREIIAVADIPATFGGAARHNVENALAAAAACFIHEVPIETIRAGLATFDASFATSPGRLNVRDAGGVTIVMDFAHNADGLSRVAPVLASLPIKGKRVALLARTRTRSNPQQYKEYGVQAAGMFDRFFLAEKTKDQSKWPPGEVARMVIGGLESAGVPNNAIHQANSVDEALEAAFSVVRPGDLLFVAAFHEAEMWQRLESFCPALPAVETVG